MCAVCRLSLASAGLFSPSDFGDGVSDTLGRGDRLWAASSASGGAMNSAICYAQLCTTQSRSDQLGLDSPIGPKLWT